jgi:hypothetical protein
MARDTLQGYTGEFNANGPFPADHDAPDAGGDRTGLPRRSRDCLGTNALSKGEQGLGDTPV